MGLWVKIPSTYSRERITTKVAREINYKPMNLQDYSVGWEKRMHERKELREAIFAGIIMLIVVGAVAAIVGLFLGK